MAYWFFVIVGYVVGAISLPLLIYCVDKASWCEMNTRLAHRLEIVAELTILTLSGFASAHLVVNELPMWLMAMLGPAWWLFSLGLHAVAAAVIQGGILPRYQRS